MYLADAANEIGVSSITLKRWILSGKVPDVARDKNNWRIFTKEDVVRIRNYHLQVSEPPTISYQPISPKHTVASFLLASAVLILGLRMPDLT